MLFGRSSTSAHDAFESVQRSDLQYEKFGASHQQEALCRSRQTGTLRRVFGESKPIVRFDRTHSFLLSLGVTTLSKSKPLFPTIPFPLQGCLVCSAVPLREANRPSPSVTFMGQRLPVGSSIGDGKLAGIRSGRSREPPISRTARLANR